jgi:transposase
MVLKTLRCENIRQTDLTDSRYDAIITIIGDKGKRRRSLKDVLDAIFYLLKFGCQWRMLPSDFPEWELVYYYYSNLWSRFRYASGAGRLVASVPTIFQSPQLQAGLPI